MARDQFTFYSSFARAIMHIKKKADRCDAYDAITRYALYEEIPDLDKLPDAAAIAFEMARPNLDASRAKAENGKSGGRPRKTESKTEISETEQKANGKQTESKTEISESKKENEKEIEKEKENECYNHLNPPNDGSDDTDDGFTSFWESYPRKSGDIKQAYFEYLGVIQKGVSPEMLMEAVAWQADVKDPEYMPSAEKWLRNKGWTEKKRESTKKRNDPNAPVIVSESTLAYLNSVIDKI